MALLSAFGERGYSVNMLSHGACVNHRLFTRDHKYGMHQFRHWISLIEGDVVDLKQHKMDKSRKEVAGLVSGFQQYLDSLERFKQEFGRFEPMLRDYRANPDPRNVPEFVLRISYDRVATAREKAKLGQGGFNVFSDSPNWGTMIHNDESGYWANGAYFPEHGKNWYTQTEAEKQITPTVAVNLWRVRDRPQIQQRYGLYHATEVHYHKGILRGDPKKGWDIRTHPEHASHYLNDKSFSIELRAPDYSQDVAIKDDDYLSDALRAYKAIHRGEQIRTSGAENVIEFPGSS